MFGAESGYKVPDCNTQMRSLCQGAKKGGWAGDSSASTTASPRRARNVESTGPSWLSVQHPARELTVEREQPSRPLHRKSRARVYAGPGLSLCRVKLQLPSLFRDRVQRWTITTAATTPSKHRRAQEVAPLPSRAGPGVCEHAGQGARGKSCGRALGQVFEQLLSHTSTTKAELPPAALLEHWPGGCGRFYLIPEI